MHWRRFALKAGVAWDVDRRHAVAEQLSRRLLLAAAAAAEAEAAAAAQEAAAG